MGARVGARTLRGACWRVVRVGAWCVSCRGVVRVGRMAAQVITCVLPMRENLLFRVRAFFLSHGGEPERAELFAEREVLAVRIRNEVGALKVQLSVFIE